MRKILILGGTGAIGNAITHEFVNDDVYSVGSSDIDLSDRDSIINYMNKVGNNFDIIIHSAGLNMIKPFSELSMDDLQESLDVNVMGFLCLCKMNLLHWQHQRYGRIVIINSLYGQFGRTERLPYTIAKHALSGVTKTLAIELAKYNVFVNSVSPGFINTKMTYNNNAPEVLTSIIHNIPLGRLGSPVAVAKTVKFLVSFDNDYITGQNIIVDGGYSVGGFQ